MTDTFPTLDYDQIQRDVFALLTVERANNPHATLGEALTLLHGREGESLGDQLGRVAVTLSVVVATADVLLDQLSTLLGRDPDVILQNLAVAMEAKRAQREQTERDLMIELRWYDPNYRPADYHNFYCPRCRCNKTGHVDEPNGRTEACDDDACPCHEPRGN